MPRQIWWKDKIDTHDRVGAALRNVRLDHKYTQREVADCIGCDTSSICHLERGEYGSLKLVEAYAWAVGYPLLGGLSIGSPHMKSLIPQVTSLASARQRKQGVSPQGAAAIRWAQGQRKAARRAA